MNISFIVVIQVFLTCIFEKVNFFRRIFSVMSNPFKCDMILAPAELLRKVAVQRRTAVNFINVFSRTFFCTNILFGSFSSYVLSLAPKFRTKNVRVNVDEIDTRFPSISICFHKIVSQMHGMISLTNKVVQPIKTSFPMVNKII